MAGQAGESRFSQVSVVELMQRCDVDLRKPDDLQSFGYCTGFIIDGVVQSVVNGARCDVLTSAISKQVYRRVMERFAALDEKVPDRSWDGDELRRSASELITGVVRELSPCVNVSSR